MLQIGHLRTEYLENPIGIDAGVPRLSWILKSVRQNVMQENYHITVAADRYFTDILWDSGIVKSDESLRVRYGGKEL